MSKKDLRFQTLSIGIGKFRVGNLDKTQVKFKTLQEYLHDAKRQIIYFCSRFYPGYTKNLLSSEDVISFVAYANMLADWRYVESNPSGTKRNSFVNGYAFGFIKIIIKNLRKKSNDLVNIDISEIYDIYDKKHDESIKKYENLELINKYLNRISPKYSNMLRDYYLNNKTYQEIGDENNISKQYVHQTIKIGISKLKDIMKNEEIYRTYNK